LSGWFLYLTLGKHDTVANFEAPNDEAIMSALLSIIGLGNVHRDDRSSIETGSDFVSNMVRKPLAHMV
jgi:uncharacterized protein with GYD domain